MKNPPERDSNAVLPAPIQNIPDGAEPPGEATPKAGPSVPPELLPVVEILRDEAMKLYGQVAGGLFEIKLAQAQDRRLMSHLISQVDRLVKKKLRGKSRRNGDPNASLSDLDRLRLDLFVDGGEIDDIASIQGVGPPAIRASLRHVDKFYRRAGLSPPVKDERRRRRALAKPKRAVSLPTDARGQIHVTSDNTIK